MLHQTRKTQMSSIIVFITWLNIPFVFLDTNCGNTFKNYDYGLCAYMSDIQMTYCDAINACARNKGRLVSTQDNLVTILLSESSANNTAGKTYYIGISVLVNKTDTNQRKLIWNNNMKDFIAASSDFPDNDCAVFAFILNNKNVITGSDCGKLHYFICEEVVQQEMKVFYPQVSMSVWRNKYDINKCATNLPVHKSNPKMHCALLCYKTVFCKSFWSNENGECRLSHLSYVVAALDDVHNWKSFMIKEENKKTKRWTTFVRRISNSVDFGVGWSMYKTGFGDVNGNFWLGLEKMHRLTQKNSAARIYFTDWDNSFYYSEYSTFNISDENSNYTISASGIKGTLCDGFYDKYEQLRSNGMQFTTIDADHDLAESNCANDYAKAGWWFNYCHAGVLTGKYYNREEVNDTLRIPLATGITFSCFKDYYYSVKQIEAKILTNEEDFN